LLEDKLVNLRIVEKEDLKLTIEWLNDPEYFGVYNPLIQISRAELEKRYDDRSPEERSFFIEKKDGSKIGVIFHNPVEKYSEIGYFLAPSERGKGYCTEAVTIILDYVFLSKDTVRIQAHIDPRNIASQKVVEKNGFKKEGTIRKCFFAKGEWRDMLLYSILREEWKAPKILTKTVPEK
jgi:ribosomal-protein-alanine N-acetyltransferase